MIWGYPYFCKHPRCYGGSKDVWLFCCYSEPLIWYECSLFVLGWLYWLDMTRRCWRVLDGMRYPQEVRDSYKPTKLSLRLGTTSFILQMLPKTLLLKENTVKRGKPIPERGEFFGSQPFFFDSFRSLSLPTVPPLPVVWPQLEARKKTLSSLKSIF